jgi:methionine synthase I (cobalamin-dependent)
MGLRSIPVSFLLNASLPNIQKPELHFHKRNKSLSLETERFLNEQMMCLGCVPFRLISAETPGTNL